MFFEIPQNLILMIAGAFLIGWLLSSISSSLSSKMRAKKRDARDDRIRSLEAELRIALSESEKSREAVKKLEKDLEESNDGQVKRDNVISHQQEKLETLSADLKDSVLKTRELRNELSDRATQNIKSEVKLREVETELEVAQASTDMIATGVLDYSLAAEALEDDVNDDDVHDESDVSKAAT
jgi:chromatin segregation and condensation protein Rec8/ScpA/Scc1 (kleisin family)